WSTWRPPRVEPAEPGVRLRREFWEDRAWGNAELAARDPAREQSRVSARIRHPPSARPAARAPRVWFDHRRPRAVRVGFAHRVGSTLWPRARSRTQAERPVYRRLST